VRWLLPGVVLALTGCATPRTVLVNDPGEHVTCVGTGYGLFGSISAQYEHDACVDAAKQKGYRVEFERH